MNFVDEMIENISDIVKKSKRKFFNKSDYISALIEEEEEEGKNEEQSLYFEPNLNNESSSEEEMYEEEVIKKNNETEVYIYLKNILSFNTIVPCIIENGRVKKTKYVYTEENSVLSRFLQLLTNSNNSFEIIYFEYEFLSSHEILSVIRDEELESEIEDFNSFILTDKKEEEDSKYDIFEEQSYNIYNPEETEESCIRNRNYKQSEGIELRNINYKQTEFINEFKDKLNLNTIIQIQKDKAKWRKLPYPYWELFVVWHNSKLSEKSIIYKIFENKGNLKDINFSEVDIEKLQEIWHLIIDKYDSYKESILILQKIYEDVSNFVITPSHHDEDIQKFYQKLKENFDILQKKDNNVFFNKEL